jgi:hypothetical protein
MALAPLGHVALYAKDPVTNNVYLVGGSPGVGVPPGGLTGTVLTKASARSYDTVWAEVATNLDGLTDVTLTAPIQVAHLLRYDGTVWRNDFAALGELRDVDLSTQALAGDALVFNPTTLKWVPGAPISQGIVPLAPCRAVAIGPIALDGTVTVLDGVTLAAGDSALVTAQANKAENGIYTVALGAPWVRRADADAEGELYTGIATLILEGFVGQGTTYVAVTVSAQAPWTPGVDEVQFFPLTSRTDFQAGPGLYLSNGTTFAVGQGTGIVVGPDFVSLDQAWLAARYGTLAGLSDVDVTTTAPLDGESLTWDATGALWVPGPGGGGGTDEVVVDVAQPTATSIELWVDTSTTLPPITGGATALDDLTDVDLTTPPTASQVLQWDGASQWKPGTAILPTGGTMTKQLRMSGDAYSGGQGYITFDGNQMLLVYNTRLGFNCQDKQPQVFKGGYNTRVDIVDTQTGDARYAPKVLADELFAPADLAFCDPAGLRAVEVTDAAIGDGVDRHIEREGWSMEAVLRGLVTEVVRLRAESDDLRERLANVLDPEE